MNYAAQILEAFNKIYRKSVLLLEDANLSDYVYVIGNSPRPSNLSKEGNFVALRNQLANAGDPNPDETIKKAIQEAPVGREAAEKGSSQLVTSTKKRILIWKVESKSSESGSQSSEQPEQQQQGEPPAQAGQQEQAAGMMTPQQIKQQLRIQFGQVFLSKTIQLFSQAFVKMKPEMVQKLIDSFTEKSSHAKQMIFSALEKRIENGKQVLKPSRNASQIYGEGSNELMKQIFNGKVLSLNPDIGITDQEIGIDTAFPQIMDTFSDIYETIQKENITDSDYAFIKDHIKITTDDAKHQRVLFISKDKKFAISLPNTNYALMISELAKEAVSNKYKGSYSGESIPDFEFDRLITADRTTDSELEDKNIGDAVEKLAVSFIQLNSINQELKTSCLDPNNPACAAAIQKSKDLQIQVAQVSTRIIGFHERFSTMVGSQNALVGDKKLIEQFSIFESNFLEHLEVSENFSQKYQNATPEQKAEAIKNALTKIIVTSKAMLDQHEIVRLADDSYSVGQYKKGLNQREDITCFYHSKQKADQTGESYVAVNLNDPRVDNILSDYVATPEDIQLVKQRAMGKTKDGIIYVIKPSLKTSYTNDPTKLATASPETTVQNLNILLNPPSNSNIEAPIIRKYRDHIRAASQDLGISDNEAKSLLEDLKKESEETLKLNTLVSTAQTKSSGGKPVKVSMAKEYVNKYSELLKNHPDITNERSEAYQHLIELTSAWELLDQENSVDNMENVRNVLSKIHLTYKTRGSVAKMNEVDSSNKLKPEAIKQRRLLAMNLLVNSGSSDQNQVIIYINPTTGKTLRIKHNQLIKNINSKLVSGEATVSSTRGGYNISYRNKSGNVVSFFVRAETNNGRTSYTYKANSNALDESAHYKYQFNQPSVTQEAVLTKYDQTLQLIESFLNNQKKLLMKLIEPEVVSSNLK